MTAPLIQSRNPALVLLDDVVCGIDGSRGAYEAVRQAAALAGPAASLTLIAVTAQVGEGRHSAAAIAPARAQRALAHARRLAEEAGVQRIAVRIDAHPPVAETLLANARGHGLLAIGAPYMPRLGHLIVGGTATEAAHRLPASLLVARRAAVPFGERLLVATDGSSRSDGLIAFAVALARERHAALTLVHSVGGPASEPAIAAQVATVTEALGTRASVHISGRRPLALILDVARTEECSLLIAASRRLAGLRALGSLTERLVHDARCSVLVLRPEDARASAD